MYPHGSTRPDSAISAIRRASEAESMRCGFMQVRGTASTSRGLSVCDCREQRSRSGKPLQGADSWSKAALRHSARSPAEPRREAFSVCGLTSRSTERGAREVYRLTIHRMRPAGTLMPKTNREESSPSFESHQGSAGNHCQICRGQPGSAGSPAAHSAGRVSPVGGGNSRQQSTSQARKRTTLGSANCSGGATRYQAFFC